MAALCDILIVKSRAWDDIQESEKDADGAYLPIFERGFLYCPRMSTLYAGECLGAHCLRE